MPKYASYRKHQKSGKLNFLEIIVLVPKQKQKEETFEFRKKSDTFSKITQFDKSIFIPNKIMKMGIERFFQFTCQFVQFLSILGIGIRYDKCHSDLMEKSFTESHYNGRFFS